MSSPTSPPTGRALAHRLRRGADHAVGETTRRREEIEQMARLWNQMRSDADQAVDECRAERAALEQRVADIEHELRIPLTNVLGYVELLKDGYAGPLTARQLALLVHVEQGVARLTAAVDSVTVPAPGATTTTTTTTPAPVAQPTEPQQG